jgi:hypothetical protein
MQKTASELIFISQINRDGSGTSPVPEDYIKHMVENKLNDRPFHISRLSLTEKTYIAMGFNSFVVKLKEEEKE